MCISLWIYLRDPVQIVACTTGSIRIEVYNRTANAKSIARIYVSINSTCPLLDFYPEKFLMNKILKSYFSTVKQGQGRIDASLPIWQGVLFLSAVA